MPGVIAYFGFTALGLIGVSAASAAVIMAVGSAVIALTVASVRRAGKLKDPGQTAGASGMSIMVRETEAPANIVFGEVQVGGVLAYVNSTGTELRSLYFEIIHTGHEIDSFIGWYLDDKYVPIADVDSGGDGSVDGNSGGHGLDDVAAGPVLYLRGSLGTDSQAVDSMLDTAFADIDSNHRHRGCARTVARCELVPGSESKWGGRSPGQITAVMRGLKCYDPRGDGTFPGGSGAQRLATPSTWPWTDNPALHWARYRTLAAPLGPGWATDRIDWQSVFDAANVCDALVAVPTAATEKRFRCDLVVDTSMEPHEVIAKILATMAGKERHFNGLWHVYAGSWPSTDFALTDDDLIAEVQYRKQPDIADRYNQVKPSFIDRNRLWKRAQGIAVNNTTLRTNRDNGRVLPKVLELEGVTREYQAQRLAMHELNHADDTGILVFPTGYNGLNTRHGDTGTVTLPEWGFSAKTFRCVKSTFVEFQGSELALKEDASGNYSDPAEGAYSTRTAAGDIVFGTVTPWYLLGVEADRWTPVLVNVTRTGSTYTKTGGVNNTWDASVYSAEGYTRAAITFKASQANKSLAVGFDTSPSGSNNESSLEYALNCSSDGTLYRLESGVQTSLGGTGYTATDLLSFIYDGTFVRYYKNGSMLHETAVASPNAVLYLDSSFYETGAAIYELRFGPTTSVGTNQIDPEAATVLVSSQPVDGTYAIGAISYSGGGTLVDYAAITSASWTNDTGESIVVELRQSGRAQLAASDSVIGRKLAMRWTLNGGGSYSYDGTGADNVNITAADYQPKATQRAVTVAAGETITVQAIIVMIIPDPTFADPADVNYRGLSLTISGHVR